MKKHSLITVLAATLLGVSAAGFPAAPDEPAGIVAEAAESNGFQYTVSSNQVTITKYTGTATSVAIPSYINGKKVVAIGSQAFCRVERGSYYYPMAVTSVTIPNTVKTIGEEAFYQVPLTSLVLPSSVTSVGDWAFYDNSALTSLEIQGGAHLGVYAFASCTSLTRATLHKNVTGECGSFNDCTSLNLLNGLSVYRNVPDDNGYSYPMITQNQNTRRVLQNVFSHCMNVKFITSYSKALADYVVESEVRDWMYDDVIARVLYDWLIRNCDYENDDNPNTSVVEGDEPKNHDPSGVFFGYGVNGNGEAVCEGFAKAYTALLTRAGVESYVLTSRSSHGAPAHAWNLVKVNGKYYQCDATWDDGTYNNQGWNLIPGYPCTSYTYFLKSNSEMIALHNGDYTTPGVDASQNPYYTCNRQRGQSGLAQSTYHFNDANGDGILDNDYNFDSAVNYTDTVFLSRVSPYFTNGFVLNQATQSVWLQYLLAVDKSPSEILYLAQHGGHI